MILGIGTDIVQLSRIEKALARHAEGFAERILTCAELKRFGELKHSAAFLSKRFAAKEAVVKALGCGIGPEASFHDIEVRHHDSGQPFIHLSGNALSTFTKLGATSIWVSISDEKEYATAMVVIER